MHVQVISEVVTFADTGTVHQRASNEAWRDDTHQTVT